MPLCALPPDKSSFPRERGAELECKTTATAGWGPRKLRGTRFPSSKTTVRECGYVYLRVCAKKVNDNMKGLSLHRKLDDSQKSPQKTKTN